MGLKALSKNVPWLVETFQLWMYALGKFYSEYYLSMFADIVYRYNLNIFNIGNIHGCKFFFDSRKNQYEYLSIDCLRFMSNILDDEISGSCLIEYQ